MIALGCIIIILWARKRIHRPYSKSMWRSTLLLFALYFLVLTYVEIRWYYIREYATSFDLNNNGFIDWEETNPESQDALKKTTNDTGRNFAFMTVGIFSFALSFIYLLFDVAITFLRVKKLKNT